MYEHHDHFVLRRTQGHSQLLALKKFTWVCFTSSFSPPSLYHPFKNPYWKIALEKYNLQVTELDIRLEETITLLCDNWLHSALSFYYGGDTLFPLWGTDTNKKRKGDKTVVPDTHTNDSPPYHKARARYICTYSKSYFHCQRSVNEC